MHSTSSAAGRRFGAFAAAVPLTTLLGCSGPTVMPAALPAPVSGERIDVQTSAGRVACWVAGPQSATAAPLLLVHSVNAAGSAYEVRPLHEHYAASRRVYSLELPGYGHSDRAPRRHTPRGMSAAILATVEEIARREGPAPIDALAVSLGSEFLARAAAASPQRFRSVALVSPTGFDRHAPWLGPPDSTRGKAWLYGLFTVDLWSRPIFDLLTSRRSVRYFLEKTWGGTNIDEGLLEYDLLTTRDPDAHHVVYDFVGGYLFSADITRVYEQLDMPVWMAHGVRGDFTDYREKGLLEGRPNWRFTVFQTGAMPYFEVPGEFFAAYEGFLAGR